MSRYRNIRNMIARHAFTEVPKTYLLLICDYYIIISVRGLRHVGIILTYKRNILDTRRYIEILRYEHTARSNKTRFCNSALVCHYLGCIMYTFSTEYIF